MNTVSVSFSKSKVFNAFDALAVRCGYLLGEKVLFAGDAHYGVYAEEMFSSKDTVKRKVLYLIEHVKHKPQEGLTVESLTQFLKDWQFLQNRKHKSTMEIKLIKQMEKAIDTTYKEAVKPYLAAFEQSGLSSLADLIGEDISLEPIDVDDRELVTEGNDGSKSVTLSKVLLDRFEPETLNDIYLVVREFDDFLAEQKLVAGSLTGALNPQAQLLSVPLFKLPAVTQMKASELQVIRTNLGAVNENFKQAMNNWSIALRPLAFHPSVFPVIQQYFNTAIAPLLAPIQNAIETEEHLVQAHRSSNYTFEMSVTLHVCPVSVFWQYLTWCQVMELNTLEVMSKVDDYEKKAQSTCLLLQCSHRNLELKTTGQKTEEQLVLSKRKTLDID